VSELYGKKMKTQIKQIGLIIGISILSSSLPSCDSGGNSSSGSNSPNDTVNQNPIAEASQGDDKISEAFSNRSSDVQVSGEGEVIKVLPDDNDGDRHQKFILKLNSNQTLLISHNIDIAPRISDLRLGDSVSFNGVYEWNSQGGVVHWTHHDPSGIHEGGWLEKGGIKYQ
jgi:hypothetical protein